MKRVNRKNWFDEQSTWGKTTTKNQRYEGMRPNYIDPIAVIEKRKRHSMGGLVCRLIDNVLPPVQKEVAVSFFLAHPRWRRVQSHVANLIPVGAQIHQIIPKYTTTKGGAWVRTRTTLSWPPLRHAPQKEKIQSLAFWTPNHNHPYVHGLMVFLLMFYDSKLSAQLHLKLCVDGKKTGRVCSEVLRALRFRPDVYADRLSALR